VKESRSLRIRMEPNTVRAHRDINGAGQGRREKYQSNFLTIGGGAERGAPPRGVRLLLTEEKKREWEVIPRIDQTESKRGAAQRKKTQLYCLRKRSKRDSRTDP